MNSMNKLHSEMDALRQQIASLTKRRDAMVKLTSFGLVVENKSIDDLRAMANAWAEQGRFDIVSLLGDIITTL